MVSIVVNSQADKHYLQQNFIMFMNWWISSDFTSTTQLNHYKVWVLKTMSHIYRYKTGFKLEIKCI